MICLVLVFTIHGGRFPVSVFCCSVLRMEKVGDCKSCERRLTAHQEAMIRSRRNDTNFSNGNREMLGLDESIEVDPKLPDEF